MSLAGDPCSGTLGARSKSISRNNPRRRASLAAWLGLAALAAVQGCGYATNVKSAGGGPAPYLDFSITNDGNKSVAQGSPVTSTITTTLLQGVARAVSFSASGLPANATGTFSPTSCSPGCATTLTINTPVSTSIGTSTITVTGTSASVTHSTTFNLTVTGIPPVDNQAPTAPGSLSGTAQSSSQISLNWTASTDNVGVAGYKVFRGGVLVSTTTALTYLDTGLTASTQYTYTVSAFDVAGNTSPPASVSVTTQAAAASPLISAVSATDVTSLGATIIWTTDRAANSQVAYGTTISYGQTSTLNTALTLSHSVSLSGLTPGTFYYFQVMSTDAAGNVAVPVAGTFMTTGVPVISLVNHSESASCGNAVTCSVALKGPVAQSNFLVITAWAINPVHVVGIGSGGSFVDGNVRNGATHTRGYLSGGYVLSATATAGPIVVTFSGATGGAQVNIREYSVSGESLAFDATVDALYAPPANPFGPPTLTLTGANDLIVSWAGASTNITSVAPPYGNADIANDETGSGTADLLNTTSGVPASWTAVNSATAAAAASMAFGFQPHPCNGVALMDGSAGVAGSALSIASLSASMQGTVGNGSTSDNWSWRLVDTGSAFTWSTAAHKPLKSPIRFCSGGNTYVDSSTLGVQYNTSSGSGQYAHFLFPGTFNETVPFASNTASAGIWFYTSLPQNAMINADVFTLFGSGSGYVNIILVGTGTNLVVECEVPNTQCLTTRPVIQSNTWYWLTLQYNYGGTHYGAVYDESMNLVGSFNATDPSNTPPGRLTFGYVDGQQLTTPNAVMYFDKLKFCYIGNCTFPLLP